MSIDDVFGDFWSMEEAIEAHPEDGFIWENHLVTVSRVNGQVEMRGKELRSPFQYAESD